MTEPGASIHAVDAADVKSWESHDMDAARASIVPADVSFRVDGPPVRKWHRRVILRGLLENAGPAPVSVTIFSGGHGAAGPFGFFVEPTAGCAQRKPRPPGPPLPMQAPPPPLVVELPARTAVHVWNDVRLDEYDWIPHVPKELEWCFHFWNEPRPRGKVVIP